MCSVRGDGRELKIHHSLKRPAVSVGPMPHHRPAMRSCSSVSPCTQLHLTKSCKQLILAPPDVIALTMAPTLQLGPSPIPSLLQRIDRTRGSAERWRGTRVESVHPISLWWRQNATACTFITVGSNEPHLPKVCVCSQCVTN